MIPKGQCSDLKSLPSRARAQHALSRGQGPQPAALLGATRNLGPSIPPPTAQAPAHTVSYSWKATTDVMGRLWRVLLNARAELY